LKTLLIVLILSLFLMVAANMASAESWAFKKLGGYYTDYKSVLEESPPTAIKFTVHEDIIKNDSMSSQVSKPNTPLKLQLDAEPISYTDLGKHYEGKENWQMLQFFLFLQMAMP